MTSAIESMMTPDPSRPVAAPRTKPYDTLVVDGGGMAVTAWTIQRDLERAEDRVRGAVYIFLTTLASLSGLISKGGKVIMAWDGKDNRAWRRGRHPWYKHGRGSVVNRQEIAVVVSQLNGILTAMGVATIQVDGREADDVVASVVSQMATNDETDILVFSDDKDYYQLVTDRIHLCRRSMNGIIITPGQAEVLNISVGPRYLAAKAISGDLGDNIRGLRQIGERKADTALKINPALMDQCLNDPNSVDWSGFEGSIRKAFVKAGRRLVWPPELEDERFVRSFCQKRGLKVPDELEPNDESCLAASAKEMAWAMDLVTMDRDMEIEVVFPKPSFDQIPRILKNLDVGDETDLHTPLYRLAGMTAPGQTPSWRSAVRAGQVAPESSDKF